MIWRTLASNLAFIALALLAFAALTFWRAGHVERRIERVHPPRGRIVQVRDGEVHVVQRGTGPDLVLLHGALTNLKDFPESLLVPLSQSYRVTLMDLPGHGYSTRQKRVSTPKAQATALADAAAILALRAPIVLGHSYGSTVALAWALSGAALPVRPSALVLIAPPMLPEPIAAPWLRKLFRLRLARRMIATFATAWTPNAFLHLGLDHAFAPQHRPKGYIRHAGTRLLLRRANFRANAEQVAVLSAALRLLAPSYPSLALPVEILHGTADGVVPQAELLAALVAQIPGARLTLLPGVGHMPHYGDPEPILAAVSRVAALALPV
ncbi:MAG: alpha/beta hydrolase [Phaeovulum sp.]|uniref:alpha/beta fold hydrolase n=1 Tax=Phaeovulum sp. TaxID=2934796 RepID=UPI0027318975|nr:alpha/beta hydrolase [Phaeovulum sp.]MDP2063173.1 alpha/beta hydrolase [Phaeovulum sp.]